MCQMLNEFPLFSVLQYTTLPPPPPSPPNKNMYRCVLEYLKHGHVERTWCSSSSRLHSINFSLYCTLFGEDVNCSSEILKNSVQYFLFWGAWYTLPLKTTWSKTLCQTVELLFLQGTAISVSHHKTLLLQAISKLTLHVIFLLVQELLIIIIKIINQITEIIQHTCNTVLPISISSNSFNCSYLTVASATVIKVRSYMYSIIY